MSTLTLTDHLNYQQHIDKLFKNEMDDGAKFSMTTSLCPQIIPEVEAQGFIDRYALIEKFWNISQTLFKQSLVDPSLKEIRELILNEVNAEFALEYHKKIYEKEVNPPLFFRTDEGVPGKITEIQSPGSGWGTLQVLQTSIPYMQKFADFPIRGFNKKTVAESLSEIILELTHNNPLVFYQIDESSVMLDTNYFISATRKYGLKYLGHDHEVSLKNANFIRTHAFMEEVTNSTFYDFLKKYNNEELIFDIFPSILFFQKISLMFPFWNKTKHLYTDEIRQIFPFTSQVTENLTLENGNQLSIENFSKLEPHRRGYYLKYAGANGVINWGSKAVYHLGKTDWKKCKVLLQNASDGYKNKHYWILQKDHHRKEEVEAVVDNVLESKDEYGKWSGFYGPKGFMGGYVMYRGFYKVHGQDDTVCKLLL